MEHLARPPRRSKKVQVFITEADFEAFRHIAEQNGEALGTVASRCLARSADEIRAALQPISRSVEGQEVAT